MKNFKKVGTFCRIILETILNVAVKSESLWDGEKFWKIRNKHMFKVFFLFEESFQRKFYVYLVVKSEILSDG